MKVKICGITNVRDALAAADSGADAVGFVLYQKSPRYIAPDRVKEITAQVPPYVTTVGVFADASEKEILSIINQCGLDAVQLQGEESPDFCRRLGSRVIKAIRIRDRSSLNLMVPYKVKAFVLDTFRPDQLGGTGITFDWDLAIEAKKFGKIILAGGLTPENVGKAIEKVRPYAVDVSSGVEEDVGKKDHSKLKRFIQTARRSWGLL